MKSITRRQILLIASGVMVTVPFAMLTNCKTLADELPPTDPEDVQAKALGYVHDSANAEQRCNNCKLYTGKEGAEWGPCPLFPGKGVNAKGWCKSWVKKAV